jgi:glycosyltransferase involved in cell wall biosynthesis
VTLSPEVTVITACHNAAPFLEECLASIRDQTLRRLEHVVVDDGSTDGSAEILRRWAERDSRLVVLSQRNRGPTCARIAGLARARAPWVAILDADDAALPRRLERQLAAARQADDIVLVGSDCVEINRDGIDRARHRYPVGHAALVRHAERFMRFVPHSSFLMRRSAVESVGGYRRAMTQAEDLDLALRLSDVGTLVSVADPLIRLRKHPASLSNAAGGRDQCLMGIAVRVSHFRRLAGRTDPAEEGGAAWARLLECLEVEMEARGVWERERRWAELARGWRPGGRTGVLRAAAALVQQPGLVAARIGLHLWGSPLGRHLTHACDERG